MPEKEKKDSGGYLVYVVFWFIWLFAGLIDAAPRLWELDGPHPVLELDKCLLIVFLCFGAVIIIGEAQKLDSWKSGLVTFVWYFFGLLTYIILAPSYISTGMYLTSCWYPVFVACCLTCCDLAMLCISRCFAIRYYRAISDRSEAGDRESERMREFRRKQKGEDDEKKE